MRDYQKLAAQYAADIISGKISSNKLVRLAVERSINDYKRQNTKAFPFIYDETKADKVCRFVECCPHTKGELAGQTIRLEPWQAWIICQLYGWQGTGDRSGKRRFRQAYIEVARGNGKSCLSSALALYHLSADGEQGAECYSAATTRDQAGIVFKDAQKMASHQTFAPIRNKLKIGIPAHALTQEHTNSKFVALSAQGNSLDGLNVSFAVIDEIHAHQTRTVYDVIESGAKKRKQSLVLSITTAGFNLSGIGHEQHEYAQKLVEGSIKDESFFAISYGIDTDDDWRTESAWKKANPNYGVSVDEHSLKAACDAAMSTPSKQPNFLTKHCNVWVSGKSRWCDVQAWINAQDKNLCIEDFAGKSCYIGVDLAFRDDLAVVSTIFPEEKDGKTHYTIFNKYYLPESTVNDGRNASYKGWVIDGYIKTNEGNAIEYAAIEDDIIEIAAEHQLEMTGFDKYNANSVMQTLANSGIPHGIVEQNVQCLSFPTKEIESLVKSGLVHIPLDPVLIWCCSNVEVKFDTNDNVKPRKAGDKRENKIDGYIAIIIALYCILETKEPEDSIYEQRGVLVF